MVDGACIDRCEDFLRFLKAVAAFLIGNVAVGLSFKARNTLNAELSEVTTHMGVVRFVGTMYTTTFLSMYFVNVLCMIYACLGSGCIRDRIWSSKDDDTKKSEAIKLCVGPCCATILQLMLFSTLATQIGVSYIYLLIACLMTFLIGICKAGHRITTMFQSTVNEFDASHPEHDSWNPMNWFITLKMEHFCRGTRGLNEAAMVCFWACVLTTVSQVLMLIVISEEKGRIEATMNEVGAGGSKKVAVGDDSDEGESSTDSDYEADPLVKYRKSNNKSQQPGGRNYKLPGGYQPKR